MLGPDSITWRVHREAVLLLGGGRALLMQIAHPLVAAAVADHSDFRQDPFGRLRRTLDAMFTITFGDADEARRAYKKINCVHGRVHGKLAEPTGHFPAGTSYRARDPELLFWVHATLVDTAILTYRRYVRNLSAGEQEQYYQESKNLARLFRIPESLIPPALEDLQKYLRGAIERGPVRVSSTARELARNILHPPVGLAPSLLFDLISLVTIGLLPPRLREGFGLEWNPTRQFLLDASRVAVRNMLPLLPDIFRAVPAARAAERAIFGRSNCDGAASP